MDNPKPQCYYNDHLCDGEVFPVAGFKKFLCEQCKKVEDSVPDDYPLDYDYSINNQ